MEFRYRAVDGDRPPPTTDTAPSQSLNPNFSSFSARPVPGYSIGPSEDHVQKAIQREIEKEQIRQEIIASETARRRELVAEVIQEMAIEREMAIRRVAETSKGMSLEEMLTMWINQNKLPDQNQDNSLVTSPMTQLPPLQQLDEATPVLESNKEKLIVLDRPDPIGAKRKADVVGLPEKEPFQRKRLESKERDMEMKEASLRNTTAETGETASSKLPCLGELGRVKSKPKSMYKFWCDVCSVGAFCPTVMRSHELGKKHKAAIEKQNESPETAASTSIIKTAPQSEAITVLESVQGQVASKEAGKKTEGEKKKTVIIRCETCNIMTNSEQMMETHKLGRKHKAQLKKQYSDQVMETYRLEKMHNKSLAVPVSSLNADPGEKGSVDHTNGMVHCLD